MREVEPSQLIVNEMKNTRKKEMVPNLNPPLSLFEGVHAADTGLLPPLHLNRGTRIITK